MRPQFQTLLLQPRKVLQPKSNTTRPSFPKPYVDAPERFLNIGPGAPWRRLGLWPGRPLPPAGPPRGRAGPKVPIIRYYTNIKAFGRVSRVYWLFEERVMRYLNCLLSNSVTLTRICLVFVITSEVHCTVPLQLRLLWPPKSMLRFKELNRSPATVPCSSLRSYHSKSVKFARPHYSPPLSSVGAS